MLQKPEGFRVKAPRVPSCGLPQALGNAGSGVLRLSRRVEKMAYNRPDPQVHHWWIPHKVLQLGVDSIFIRVSQLLAIFFMQLGGSFERRFLFAGAAFFAGMARATITICLRRLDVQERAMPAKMHFVRAKMVLQSIKSVLFCGQVKAHLLLNYHEFSTLGLWHTNCFHMKQTVAPQAIWPWRTGLPFRSTFHGLRDGAAGFPIFFR